jgi:hypothetical protein
MLRHHRGFAALSISSLALAVGANAAVFAIVNALWLRPLPFPDADDDGLQVDFMSTVHGLRSFEGVRDRAALIDLGGIGIRVASLADVIKSKRAAGRARDRAVLELLEKTHAQATKPSRPPRRARPGKRPRRG